MSPGAQLAVHVRGCYRITHSPSWQEATRIREDSTVRGRDFPINWIIISIIRYNYVTMYHRARTRTYILYRALITWDTRDCILFGRNLRDRDWLGGCFLDLGTFWVAFQVCFVILEFLRSSVSSINTISWQLANFNSNIASVRVFIFGSVNYSYIYPLFTAAPSQRFALQSARALSFSATTQNQGKTCRRIYDFFLKDAHPTTQRDNYYRMYSVHLVYTSCMVATKSSVWLQVFVLTNSKCLEFEFWLHVTSAFRIFGSTGIYVWPRENRAKQHSNIVVLAWKLRNQLTWILYSGPPSL